MSSAVLGRPFLGCCFPFLPESSRIQRRIVDGWTIVASSFSAEPRFLANRTSRFFSRCVRLSRFGSRLRRSGFRPSAASSSLAGPIPCPWTWRLRASKRWYKRFGSSPSNYAVICGESRHRSGLFAPRVRASKVVSEVPISIQGMLPSAKQSESRHTRRT